MSCAHGFNGTPVSHDDWCLLDVSDLGPYHDPRYSEKGGGMSAWDLHDHGTEVLAKIHALLGFGDEKVCPLCDERYDRIRDPE